MSDVPELDSLLEESENIRHNMKWRRRDRVSKLFFIAMLFSFPLFLLTLLIFGPAIASISMVAFFLVVMVPFICETFFDIINELLKDDWE